MYFLLLPPRTITSYPFHPLGIYPLGYLPPYDCTPLPLIFPLSSLLMEERDEEKDVEEWEEEDEWKNGRKEMREKWKNGKRKGGGTWQEKMDLCKILGGVRDVRWSHMKELDQDQTFAHTYNYAFVLCAFSQWRKLNIVMRISGMDQYIEIMVESTYMMVMVTMMKSMVQIIMRWWKT